MKIKGLIFLLIIPALAFGQYRFSHLTVEEGLVENSVTDIFQDSEGYLWFTTQDGVSQYDGYHFKNYVVSSHDSTSLSDNFLWGINEDSLGYIWVCSRIGLNRIDKHTGVVTKFYRTINGSMEDNQIADIAVFHDSIFISVYEKIYILPIKSNYPQLINSFEHIHTTELTTSVLSFFIDKQKNQLYCLQGNGLYNYTTKQMHAIADFKEGMAHSFLKATQEGNTIWFTNSTQVYSFNTEQKTIETLNYPFTDVYIQDLDIYQGELWVATNNGIFIFKNNQLVRTIHKTNLKNILTSNYVASIFHDKSGKLWLGTAGRGICYYNPKHDNFKFLSEETFQNKFIVRGILQDEKRLFVYGGNNYVLTLKNKQLTRTNFAGNAVAECKELKIKELENSIITKMAMGFNGDIIIGTRNNDLLVLDKNLNVKKKIVLNKPENSAIGVSDIMITRSNQLWVATFYGLYIFDNTYRQVDSVFMQLKGLETNYLLTLFQDKAGAIWIGTNDGAYQYNKSHDKFIHFKYDKRDLKHSPGFNFVTGFADFNDGFLWMATYGGGLSKLNQSTREFQHFTSKQGLQNNVCNGLLSDNHHNIWINTNRGISQFDTKTEKFINYDKADGLLYNEFNLNSYFKNESGEMFFGTPIGLIVFNPDSISISYNQPAIVYTGIDINYEDKSGRLINNSIDLYLADKVITFHFAGLNFSQSSKIKYKYKLKGYDDQWIETTELKANYTSLPDGKFNFLINATNEDGIWNSTPKKIKVVVHPPYYKTWWFISLCTFILLLIIILTVRYFSQRKIKKRLEELKIQHEIHQVKQEISRDLHDNIGSQLTFIISSVDNMKYLFKTADDKLTHKLTDVSNFTRTTITQLRDTIWALNKEEISFEDLKSRLFNYLENAKLAQEQTTFSFNYNLNTNYFLTSIQGVNIYRIIQEAINNTMKYAAAVTVELTLEEKENQISIQITDDGIGFTLSEIKLGNGLENMKKRADQIVAEFIIDSTLKKGTTIKIILDKNKLNAV